MSAKILLFGANGQVGGRLKKACDRQGIPCIALGRGEADFTALEASVVQALLEQHAPTHIINTAAFTAVDASETQPELAFAVNAEAPKILAQVAQALHIPLLHCSTDYVFDGATGAPYTEEARVNPLGQYGKSKLYGEQSALDAGARVFRLQWVFDTRGSNFFLTMKRLLTERDSLRVVGDQLGAPSFAKHIADALLAARDTPAGLYHLAAGGYTSWHGFACAIAQGLGRVTPILPITTAEYPLPATRPRDTRLDCTKLHRDGIAMPHWTIGLNEALHETH